MGFILFAVLIGCITGPDLETTKRQIKLAKSLCDGIELRKDLLKCDIPDVEGFCMHTEGGQSTLSNGKTLSTYHNFAETPQDLDRVLDQMPPADFYKIATMANKITDALRMLAFVKVKKNVAGMCMGELGQITRILGPVVGSPFTFAALGRVAAPGQLQAEELVSIYRFSSLSPTTKIYGLIGNPISQSPSHKTHNAYFSKNGIDAVYVRMLLEEEELPLFFDLAKQLKIQGLSVTIPFKEKLFDFIDVLETDAKEIGAVNTLSFEDRIYGSNTDGKGALDAIEEKVDVHSKHCVLLGAGGSAKAIAFEAKRRGAGVTFLSRRFGNLDNIPEYDILINTTPVPAPIDIHKLLPGKVVMDINVAHKETPLMFHAKSLGCRLIFGYEMFEKQALGQFRRWGLIFA